MYMEAYGGATSVAEGIIKKAVTTKVGIDEAEAKLAKKKSFEGEPQMTFDKTDSEAGISPNNDGGVGSKADPNIVKEMQDYEKMTQMKAMESLNSKIENLQARNIYLEGLQANLENRNAYLENKLGKQSLKK